MKIPPSQQWVRTNSDLLGSLWSGFGLNLTEEMGKTKISPRMILTTNGTTSVLGTPVAFRGYNQKLYVLSNPSTPGIGGMWVAASNIVNGGLTQTVSSEVSSGVGAINYSNDYSDLEVFNNKLFVSGNAISGGDVLYFGGSSWTDAHPGGSMGGNSVVKKFLNFVYLKRLYMTATLYQIISCNTSFSFSTSGTNTLELQTATGTTDMFLTGMLQTNTLIWVLTANFYNNECFVYTWDGVTADTIQSAYRINARGVLAGIVKDGTPYILDCDGQLSYFNGQTFIPAKNGKLPIKPRQFLTNPISQTNNRWIHPNGITLVDGRINILINNLNHDNAGTINENLPSSIWEYDPEIGWYPKIPLTQYDLNGAATVLDYGQNRLSRVGALYNVKSDDRSSAVTVGTLVAGGDYYTTATAIKTGIWINDSLDLIQKYGYFVTSKILASNAKDVFSKVYARIKPLLTATDKIWVKYRIKEAAPLEVTITWVSATSFTTTTDVTAYTEDDEVEVTQGTGGGFCSQIQSIVNNAGVYTVTVKDSFPAGVTGTAKARFQHWHLASSFSNQTDNTPSFGIDKAKSSAIQLKVCMLYTGNNELYDLLLENPLLQ